MGSKPKTIGSLMTVKCPLNRLPKACPTWPFNLAIPTLTYPLCLDLSESLCFLLDAIRIMDLNCSIWTLPALVRYDAKAIGSGSEGAQQSLQEVFHKGMTMKEAIKHALSILKQVMEEKLSESNVEVSTVTKDKGFQLFKGDDLQDFIKDLS